MTSPEADSTIGGSERSRVREAAAVLVFGLLVCAFFREAVALRGVFFHYDHALQNYPYREFFARGLRDGQMPLWSSDLFCGFPLFAESQGNAAYPPFLALFSALRPWVAYNYYTVLHFLMAGLFTYLFARVMGVGRAGSVLAGVIFTFSGPVLYHAHHTNIIVGISWLPLLLALIELMFRRRTWWPALGFAAATAALILGAQPQYTMYAALVCAIFMLWRISVAAGEGGVRSIVKPTAALCAAGVLGGLMAAVQLLPTAELVSRTSRGGGMLFLVAPGEPGNLMTLMLPHYFGSPGLGTYWNTPGPGLHSELTLYVGVASLMLAGVGVLTARTKRDLFFVGLGSFAFLFSMGFCGSIYNLFALLPVLGATRFPSRFAYVTALCVGMLAGIGLDRLLKCEDRRRVRRAALISAGCVMALAFVALVVTGSIQHGLSGLTRAELVQKLSLRPPEIRNMWDYVHTTLPADTLRLVLAAVVGGALLVASARWAASRRRGLRVVVAGAWLMLVFLDLAVPGREFSPVTDPALYEEPPPLAAMLQKENRGYRIYRYGYKDREALTRPLGALPYTRGWHVKPELYVACLDRLPHNANMLWGIPSVNGFSPLQTLAIRTMLGQPNNSNTIVEYEMTPVLDLLGARYILSPLREVPGDLERVDSVSGVNVFLNPRALPRAFIVHRGKRTSPQDGLEELQAPGFDYAGLVLLHDEDAPIIDEAPGRQGEDEDAAVADSGDEIEIVAALDRPGYLVLTDQHYPGWQVEVDGEPGEILHADYMLKAVALQAGTHTVTFSYRPKSVRWGQIGTWVGLLILLGCVVNLLRRKEARHGLGTPEAELPIHDPYNPRARRLVIFGTVLFLVVTPFLRPSLWRNLGVQLHPHSISLRHSVPPAPEPKAQDEGADQSTAPKSPS